MKTIALDLPHQFRVLCILIRVDPQQFLQNFVRQIIIPSVHFKPSYPSALSTDSVLSYVELIESNIGRYTKEQRAFLWKKERQYQTLRKNWGKYKAEEAAEALDIFLKLWLKEWEDKFDQKQ